MSVRFVKTTSYRIWCDEHVGVFSGAAITQLQGKWTDGGQLGFGFAILGAVVFIAMMAQLIILKPKVSNME